MSARAPHFLLFSESRRRAADCPASDWRFILQSLDGTSRLEAEDAEPDLGSERLELLAVVRGLEALEQPSHVTLVTPSKYVARGLSYGLADWRENNWNWEHHGQMVPIKNRDLWQRLDRALAFHRVQCRTAPSAPLDEPIVAPPPKPSTAESRETMLNVLREHVARTSTERERQNAMQFGIVAAYRQLVALVRRLFTRLWELESPTGRWRIS